MKITLAQLNPTVGALKANADLIIAALEIAKKEKSHFFVTPELALCGYPPLDLLFAPGFMDAAEAQLQRILSYTKDIVACIGAPRRNPAKKEKFLFDSAIVMRDQKIVGAYDKMLLPTYDVFDERRYFEEGKKPFSISVCGYSVALTICEDIWQHGGMLQDTNYRLDPVEKIKEKKPDLLVNLSASPYSLHKQTTRYQIGKKVSHFLGCPVVLCNQVGANDGLIFDGGSIGVDPKGKLFLQAKSCREEIVSIDLADRTAEERQEGAQIQTLTSSLILGIRDYFHKSGFRKGVIGLSGGVDSAVVLVLAKEALGRSNVHALALPSRYSSPTSAQDAHFLASKLGIVCDEISIEPVFQSYLDLLKPYEGKKKGDTTQENLQARIRCMLLMAFANKEGALLLGTSNKSELAMGYSTVYGDLAGALCPLGDLYKEEVYALAKHLRVIPDSILTKAPTAELKPDQKDSDTLPPYEILDPILQDYIEGGLSASQISAKRHCTQAFVLKIIKTIHMHEWRRKQGPLILRTSEKALTPLVGRNVPTVHQFL